jgi:hypothetical protein
MQSMKYWCGPIMAHMSLVTLLAFQPAAGQTYWQRTLRVTAHNQGNIQLTLNNSGDFGGDVNVPDPLTGDLITRISYPRNGGYDWEGYISPLFGGTEGFDTLVTFWEFLPDQPPEHQFSYESIDATSPLYSKTARSELDIVCRYNDSITDPQEQPPSGKNHRSLGIHVTQRSMAWSTPNLDDFVLVDLTITTSYGRAIHNGYVGLRARIDVNRNTTGGWPLGIVVGRLDSFPTVTSCGYMDTLKTYYFMNHGGRPCADQWCDTSVLAALGIAIFGTPQNAPVAWNWGVSVPNSPDNSRWWPLKTKDQALRYSLSQASNISDRTTYFFLSNGYQAYDQADAALDHSGDGWLSPPPEATEIAEGYTGNIIYLGAGPFDMVPNQTVHFTYAIVGGDNVHVNPTDFATYWNPYNPNAFYETLDFTELATNARWAKWVYDNPGVDTDGDGYFGKFRVCDADTQWYEGDGVPDFRADVSPPSPKLKVIPSIGKLVLRWNGYYSETTIDPFTRQKDFEGYRVYVGLDDRESSMSTMISWDYQDYNRYNLKKKPDNTFAWVTGDLPYTLDSLRILYGNIFNPLLYTKENPLHILDTLYMFTSVDYNLSSLIAPGVHKVYPDARYLGTDTSQWTEDDLTNEHGGRLPKYYEYEYEVDNLLPTIAQYVSVTAFDFGFSKGNIPAKESSKRQNMTVAYAQTSSDSAVEKGLNVYVYPNPYRLYVNYAAQGYENHDNRQIPSRSHRVNFGNLPPKCKISIFSLDGDLIRSWDHDYSPTDPQAMHDAWDLITRNTMLAVSGLYYWVVESTERTQIGKFVIIE